MTKKASEANSNEANNKQIIDILSQIRDFVKIGAKDYLTIDEVCMLYDLEKKEVVNLINRSEILLHQSSDGRLWILKDSIRSSYIQPDWVTQEELKNLNFH